MEAQQAGFRPQRRLPGLVIRFVGTICRTATMPGHFPAHLRHGAVQMLGDRTKRCTRSDSSRDILSLRQCECFTTWVGKPSAICGVVATNPFSDCGVYHKPVSGPWPPD